MDRGFDEAGEEFQMAVMARKKAILRQLVMGLSNKQITMHQAVERAPYLLAIWTTRLRKPSIHMERAYRNGTPLSIAALMSGQNQSTN